MVTRIRLIGDRCSHPGEFYKYQKYYIQGFRKLDQVNFSITPIYSKICAGFTEGQIKGAGKLWRFCHSFLKNGAPNGSNHVGRYIFNLGAKRIKVAIDTSDGKKIKDEGAYQWCDLYFKANKWSKIPYPTKVYPLVNGNGLLNENKFQRIKELRNRKKEVDLIFMSVIYGSTSQKAFLNNIEHHVRLFESLAKVNCSKILKAIVPKEYSMDIMKPYLDRLDHIQVPWSNSWDGMSSSEFWDHLAKSKIVFLRPGKHSCISWRMIDLLCMGACIVYDASPYPNWPVPLVPGRNYLECACGLDMEESLPPVSQYKNIIRVIEDLLSDQEKMAAMRNNNGTYFDMYANPKGVAGYILDMVKNCGMVNQMSNEYLTFSESA